MGAHKNRLNETDRLNETVSKGTHNNKKILAILALNLLLLWAYAVSFQTQSTLFTATLFVPKYMMLN